MRKVNNFWLLDFFLINLIFLKINLKIQNYFSSHKKTTKDLNTAIIEETKKKEHNENFPLQNNFSKKKKEFSIYRMMLLAMV